MHPQGQLFNLDEHLSNTAAAFDALKEIIQHSRETLITERAKAEVAALEAAKTMRIEGAEPITAEEKEQHAVLFAYSPLINKYCGSLPRFANYSILIQLYALFEDRGTALCHELLKRDPSIPLKLGEFGKPNFDTIKTYLTKLCKVEYAYWSEIELLTQIRHRIAHNNGHTDDVPLVRRLLQTKGIEVSIPYHYDATFLAKVGIKVEKEVVVTDPANIDLDYMYDPDYVPPDDEKPKPYIIVKNAYVDHIVPVVYGLFEKVFKEKGFGNQSPFTKRLADAPLIIEGTGDTLKVTVEYED